MARPKLTVEQKVVSNLRRKTQQEARERRVMRQCDNCKVSYLGERIGGSYRWCSNCMYVELVCRECKKSFGVHRKFYLFRGASFCSLECSRKQTLFDDVAREKHPNWKGGINSVIARRARLRGATGSHTLDEWETLKKNYSYMCLCCKKQEPEIKLEEDHIIPLIKGGSNDISNIQPLCRSCNARKHDKYIDFISPYQIKEIKL